MSPLLTGPPPPLRLRPCSPSLPHLDFSESERKQSRQSPEDNRRRGHVLLSPLSAPSLIYFFLRFFPPRCDSTSLWPLLSHTSLHFLLPTSFLSALILTPRVLSGKITKSTGRQAENHNLTHCWANSCPTKRWNIMNPQIRCILTFLNQKYVFINTKNIRLAEMYNTMWLTLG